ncbi:MAG: hypothetical protein ACRDLA_00330 [Thermoleophilaceae bacterium]
MSSLVAVASLFGAVALTPVIGGVLFAFVLIGIFLLALVGVMAGLEDRTVRQRDPDMDPTRWRLVSTAARAIATARGHRLEAIDQRRWHSFAWAGYAACAWAAAYAIGVRGYHGFPPVRLESHGQ